MGLSLAKQIGCAYCKFQIPYVFHAECTKGYSNCVKNGGYTLFERVELDDNYFEIAKNRIEGLK